MSAKADSGDLFAYRQNYQNILDTLDYIQNMVYSLEGWQIFWLVFASAIVALGAFAWTRYIPWDQPKITKKVFMDIALKVTTDRGEEKIEQLGRVEFGLYGDVCPLTTENFRQLCTGEARSKTSGEPLSYKDTVFHQVRKGFTVQGGDTTTKVGSDGSESFHTGSVDTTGKDGSGGEGIYGETFPDENHTVTHGKFGVLAMAKKPIDGGVLCMSGDLPSLGSQFVIHTQKSIWNDGYDCVFGEVTKGYWEVVKYIDFLAGADDLTYVLGPQDLPGVRYNAHGPVRCKVYVADCGEVPFTPLDTKSGLSPEQDRKIR